VLRSLIASTEFNIFCAVVTLAFAVFVGVEADLEIKAAINNKDAPAWVGTVVNIFNIFFATEVGLRMLVDGPDYFIGKEWRWNLFDVALVGLSVMDMLAETGAVGFLRILRSLKILKAVRIVRLLRLFHELRLLIASMLTSLASLAWSLIFLALVDYLAALAFVQAAVGYIKDESRTNNVARDIGEYYYDVPMAMYTLILSITGGIDWSVAADPVWHFGWLYGAAFLGYVLFALLGILNVVTSVFVEHAANMKSRDHDFAITEELHHMQREIEETSVLFQELDKEGKGEIAVGELHNFLRRDRIIAHFAALGIDVSDRKFISVAFSGNDKSGNISIRDFVSGCISLRGAAKQSDTLSIVVQVKRLEKVLRKIEHEMVQNFRKLNRQDLKLTGKRSQQMNEGPIFNLQNYTDSNLTSAENVGSTTC
jgi:hypothetical protein